jgi:hypothetical protein
MVIAANCRGISRVLSEFLQRHIGIMPLSGARYGNARENEKKFHGASVYHTVRTEPTHPAKVRYRGFIIDNPWEPS